MQSERAPIRSAVVSEVTRSGDASEELHAVGRYHVVCRDADGNVKWEDDFPNLVTTIGKNFILDSALSGSAYTAAFYLGLVDGASAPTYATADTAASHAGWAENQSYGLGTRPALSFSAATGGAKASTSTNFAISANATIAGCFLTTSSAKGGTAGTLISAGSFTAGSRGLLAGDQLAVTYSLSI
jgi:hypothetical protein